MIKAEFQTYGSYTYTTDSLYQWDLNQVLQITGLNIPVAPVIHFCNRNSDKSLMVQSTMDENVITCAVPNSLLEESLDIVAYMVSMEDQKATTLFKVLIPVNKRVKPSDYEYTDNVPILTYEAIKADIQHFFNLSKSYTDDAKAKVDASIQATNIDLSNEVADRKAEVAVERARIDNFVSLPNGSTTGDAELMDVRVGSDGVRYSSAGNAVRTQFGVVFDVLRASGAIKQYTIELPNEPYTLSKSDKTLPDEGVLRIYHRASDGFQYSITNTDGTTTRGSKTGKTSNYTACDELAITKTIESITITYGAEADMILLTTEKRNFFAELDQYNDEIIQLRNETNQMKKNIDDIMNNFEGGSGVNQQDIDEISDLVGGEE